jgi:hypothetical protein
VGALTPPSPARSTVGCLCQSDAKRPRRSGRGDGKPQADNGNRLPGSFPPMPVPCLDQGDSDSNPDPQTKNQAKFPMYASDETPYVRAGIFPWGRLGQEFQGEKVVSERAIKHLHGLCSLASASASAAADHKNDANADGDQDDADAPPGAAVLFVVNRGDCESFRPGEQACPVFARTLRQARDAGVLVLAGGVTWDDTGVATWTGPIPVVL